MGITLKVTPEVLTRMAGDIEKQIDDVKQQFDAIGNEITRSRSYWEGDASTAHMTQYQEMKDEIDESVNRLRNHPENLLQMAGLYRETETEVTAVTQSLSEDVIV